MRIKRSLVLVLVIAGLAWTFAVLNAYSQPAAGNTVESTGNRPIYTPLSLKPERAAILTAVYEPFLAHPRLHTTISIGSPQLLSDGIVPPYPRQSYKPIAMSYASSVHSGQKQQYAQTISSRPSSSQPTRGGETCTVNTTANSGTGSLRSCLQNIAPGDFINFNTSVFPPGSPATINLLTELPPILVDNLTIDGSDAGVILNGSSISGPASGLWIQGADNVTVRGLQILNFYWDSITIIGPSSGALIGGDRSIGQGTLGQGNVLSNNGDSGLWLQNVNNIQVMGNNIGTNLAGNTALGSYEGIWVGGSQNITIGGSTLSTRNVISGNEYGIVVQGYLISADNNVIAGNYIGTNANGTAALANATGIIITSDAANNVIGGEASGARNIISGNLDDGIRIQDIGATNNYIWRNLIGTDHTGTQRLGNFDGIVIGFGAQNNVVGGNNSATRNIISGNSGAGVVIYGWSLSATSGNEIKGNYIGLDLSGTMPLSNTIGVAIASQASYNLIGGNGVGEANIISGNSDIGIVIESSGTNYNEIRGNLIGTNPVGSQVIGNYLGIVIHAGAQHNVVGGSTPAMRNLISGNVAGIVLEDANTSGNQASGNYIGTDIAGLASLGNNWGVVIHVDAANNVIGGIAGGEENVISGNEGPGVAIEANASQNQILGNLIGTDKTGGAALGNRVGILLGFGAALNVVGGANANLRNIISGNSQAGVQIQDAETTQNQVFGNFIGTDITGSLSVPNNVGVALIAGAHHNMIGSEATGTGNIISANYYYGIEISNFEPKGNGTRGNTVQSNFVGTDITGEASLGNMVGVIIFYGAHDNNIGNGTPESGNLISGNVGTGIIIAHDDSIDNVISNNQIGLSSTGNPLGNGESGVFIDGGKENTIGIGNTIAHNGLNGGVVISGTQTLENTITRNRIFGNDGPAIHFANGPLPIPPTFIFYDSLSHRVFGNSCPQCVVEIFTYSGVEVAGMQFMGTGMANSQGHFSIALPPLSPDLPYLSATVTANRTTYPFFAIGEAANHVFLPLTIKR